MQRDLATLLKESAFKSGVFRKRIKIMRMTGTWKSVAMGTPFLAGAFLAGVLALGFEGGTAHAETASQKIASTDPASIKAGTYVADPAHSQVAFSVSHFGFTHYNGLFSDAQGELAIDPAAPEKTRLRISIPIASVVTTSQKLTEELKSADWLDSAKFPQATFVATKVTLAGKDHAMVPGNLTLHGVTKHVVLRVRLVGTGINPMDKKQTIGFEAYTEIHRGEFGITKYLPVVGDEVKLRIAGAFELKE
ncbi:putative exported protein [Granulibacter bethesdensis]|uniref:Exported protein n=3 Tax=Granulibacter bethesdensis TaxID=364410 RepID=Q0BRM9_GRABC|nr:putative exported protein [Granulibacter bethesdensis CGDNIH1]AHJ68535.1 putative exported protein [Granulibacter bethesdensis]APH52365.1 putative exported protein [Granulibacter bethesdensis]APH65059.1 putative exported protein [Granulibacter bethesdensis]